MTPLGLVKLTQASHGIRVGFFIGVATLAALNLVGALTFISLIEPQTFDQIGRLNSGLAFLVASGTVAFTQVYAVDRCPHLRVGASLSWRWSVAVVDLALSFMAVLCISFAAFVSVRDFLYLIATVPLMIGISTLISTLGGARLGWIVLMTIVQLCAFNGLVPLSLNVFFYRDLWTVALSVGLALMCGAWALKWSLEARHRPMRWERD